MAGAIDLRTMASYRDNFYFFCVGSREIGKRKIVLVDRIQSAFRLRWLRGLLLGHRVYKTLFSR